MINDIRNYFNRLVKNTKNDNIKFFSNIELGIKKDNPHLHIQVWHENQKQIDKIYNKIIERFGLFSEYCKLTEQKNDKKIFEYVIKDYSKNMNNDDLLALDDSKRVFRGVLEKKIRFSSHSKSKYTKAIYKSLYASNSIAKDDVDYLLDNNVIDINGNIIDKKLIDFLFILLLSQIYNKSESIECFDCWFKEYQFLILFEWWTYGKLWRN